jgi:hypothetical protein
LPSGENNAEKKGTKEELSLPSSYYLDESDPDIPVLRRQDGTFVAAFSAQGATKEGIVEVAQEDWRALVARKPPGST